MSANLAAIHGAEWRTQAIEAANALLAGLHDGTIEAFALRVVSAEGSESVFDLISEDSDTANLRLLILSMEATNDLVEAINAMHVG